MEASTVPKARRRLKRRTPERHSANTSNATAVAASPIWALSATMTTLLLSTEKNPPSTTTAMRSPDTGSIASSPSARIASRGEWPGRIPISPSLVRALTILAAPDHTNWSAATISTSSSAILLGLLLDLGPLALNVIQAADVEERLLCDVVEVAVADGREAFHGVLDGHGGAFDAGELLRRVGVLREELLDAACTRHDDLVLFGELIDTEDGDDVLEFLVLLQDLLDADGRVVVVVSDVLRIQDAGGRRQRVNGRVQTTGSDFTGKFRGRVEVCEGRGRSRVGVVICGDIDGLHRGDGVALGGRDALLEETHLVSQVGLVAHGRRHAAEEGGNLGTCLGEAEDVVDEEQHVLVLHIAEVLRHGQRGQGNAQTRSRRLIHLAEDKRGVLEDAGLFHFDPEVVAFTGTLANAGEHRGAAEVAGNTGDHFLDQHGLADAGAAEQADLATLDVRGEEVDHLDAGFQHFGGALEGRKRRSLAVDRPAFADLQLGLGHVQGLAQDVEDVALDAVADGDGDRGTGVNHVGSADQAVGRLQRDGANEVVAEVQRNFEGDGLGLTVESNLRGECVVNRGDCVSREFDVDNRANNTCNTAGGTGRCGYVFGSSGSHLSHFTQ